MKELAAMPKGTQEKAYEKLDVDGMTKREITRSLLSMRAAETQPDSMLAKARKLIDRYAKGFAGTLTAYDRECIEAIRASLQEVMDASEGVLSTLSSK